MAHRINTVKPLKNFVVSVVFQNGMEKELSEKVHMYQADISKIERGVANPSVQTLKRLADGMGMQLKVKFNR